MNRLIPTDVLQSDLEDFGFSFPEGFKWATEMSREELLSVIKFLREDREHQRRAFNEMSQMLEVFR